MNGLDPECVASVANALDEERARAARYLRRRAAALVTRSALPQPPWPRVSQTGHKGIADSMQAAATFAVELAQGLEAGDHYAD